MKLLLVDGNNMLFKAYYATAYGRPMTSNDGRPTGAVFGFINMLQKGIDLIQPDAILVAFDAGKHTFRHELYPEYKGGRKPAPDDLVPQFQMVRDCLDSWHIKWKEMTNIEADDLIGTMSKQASKYETYIFSGDHDLLQLVDESTTMLLSKKGMTDMDLVTPEYMKENMGIEPLQIIDMKGLMGDHSDNIPGIPGIGEKTALKLLTQYGSLESVIAHKEEIKGALGKKIQEGVDSALLSKKLATIQRDVELDFTAEDCSYHPDYKSFVTFLESLNMNSLVKKYSEFVDTSLGVPVVESPKIERSFVKQIDPSFFDKEIAIFVNATSHHFLDAEVHGVAFCNGKQTIYLSIEDFQKDIKAIESLKQNINVIGFDVKRNMHLLERNGIAISYHDDAMLLASLVDSTLTSTDKIYSAFGIPFSNSYEDVYGKPNKPELIIDEEKELSYVSEHVEAILSLKKICLEKLEAMGMHDLYYNIEMPLTKILKEMEDEGIPCDIEILNGIAEKTYAEIEQKQKSIYEEAGKEFNINSPKQLGEVLYDDLGLPSGKKRSTSADVLEKMKGWHPIIAHILVYRKLSKLYSTYAEGLKKYIRKDGKIHTIYNQAATQTGRLSSSEPNLQNISVRDEQGKEIRKAFLPEEGCVLISSDYHQIELRMLAHMANEKGLIDAFRSDIDIHTKTAMDIFGVSQEEVTSSMRRQAKTVNFGIVYGISDFGLSEQLGVPVKEARSFIEKYYASYPGIRTYMESLVQDCEKNGYVETLCHRRREIPEIHDKNRMVREFGKRAAMNAPVQGSAADLIKIAMIHIDKAMKETNVKSKMILQVHDELIFNVPEEEISQMKQLIEDGMIHAMELKVPLTAECAVGKDWYEAK